MVLGVMITSIGSTRFIARGIPSGMQVWTGSSPDPPWATSARFASKIFWYSGVSGACWPRAGGFVELNTPSGPTRCHCPAMSGYFFWSNGCCAAAVPARSALASAMETVMRPNGMSFLPT